MSTVSETTPVVEDAAVPDAAAASVNEESDLTGSAQRGANAFYNETWGKQWVRQRETLRQSALVQPGSDSDDDEEFSYDCIKGFGEILRYLWVTTATSGNLVVLEEFRTFIDLLEHDAVLGKGAIAITGHPGIGKTTFLIYLLLHRLERMQPTAIQLGTAHYFIFDKHGAVIRPLDYKDDRLRACWALSDSNASNVAGPCEAFLGGALRVIQTTPPKPERWKEWIKQKEGSAVVMDLPNVMEIAAVVKERGYDPRGTLEFCSQWGPSIRAALEFMAKGNWAVDGFQASAATAATAICRNPSVFRDYALNAQGAQSMLHNVGSGLLFIRPKSLPAMNGSVRLHRGIAQAIIPTDFLAQFLADECRKSHNDNALEILHILSSQSYTSSAAGHL